MLLDRRWIEEHIPHKEGMCLLDEVLSWDLTQTQCRTATHRSPHNPLRAHGRLGSACAIEYAAQTMAVHGALVASASGGVAPPGLLASVRGVRLNIDRLDVFEADLVTLVRRVAGNESTALYEFSVSADDLVLVTGRAAIAFKLFAGVTARAAPRSADPVPVAVQITAGSPDNGDSTPSPERSADPTRAAPDADDSPVRSVAGIDRPPAAESP